MLIRILKEPLLHFLVVGAGIFLWFMATDDAAPRADANVIEVTATDVNILATQFEGTWQRPPTADERDMLIDGLIRQEVLVREAIALGMDQNDAIIRRRLQQKMEFFVASVADSLDPSMAELNEYYQANASDYQIGPRLAFSQVFLGVNPTKVEVSQALDMLQSDVPLDQVGKASQLPAHASLASEARIDAIFGTGFAQASAGLPVGEWAGPVKSGYGYHLLRLDQLEVEYLPSLQDVQAKVAVDWRASQKAKLMDIQFQKLLARYRIDLLAAPTEDAQ